MNSGRTVFAQLLDFFPRSEFDRLVTNYRGDFRVRRFSCFEQWLCLLFAQLTYRESLRDIETCLRAMQPKLYHSGFRGAPARNTLACANEKRDWRMYSDLAMFLIGQARTLYAGDAFDIDLEETAYAFDSTTIDLCLSLFPWARFRTHKAGIKLHTLLDLRGNIPCFIQVTEAKTHDVNALDDLPLEAGAFYMMDRGYIDFRRLYRFTEAQSFFVVRAKKNLDFRTRSTTPIDKTLGLRSDQVIDLTGLAAAQHYPIPLRRVHYYDDERKKRLVFLTNNFAQPAMTIAQLYKCRWRVELFFKWIKQHLRIKAFYGTSPNAVRTQIWIAISAYVLVAIVKKKLKLERSLYEILQILSLTLFEKSPILKVLTTFNPPNQKPPRSNQLSLF